MINILKSKKVWIGMIAPILIQLVVLLILIPAMKGMENNVEDLAIAVVNEDDQMGIEITKQIQESLPFKVVDEHHKQQAMNKMDDGTYQMVISIPSTFTSEIQESKPQIDFAINQAVPPTMKSSMDQIAKQITATMNDKIFDVKKLNMQKAITSELTKILDGQMGGMVDSIFQNLQVHTLDGEIKKIHDVDGSISSLFPLLLFISTFAGAIIMVMIHFQAFKGANNRWSAFINHQFINGIAAILFPIAGWIIINAFAIEITLSLSTFWLFLSLTFWTFTLFVQVFIYLFGIAGQGINAILILTQAVSSGLLIPVTMLPGFYKSISNFLPGTYYSEGIYSVIFGSPSLSSPCFMLLLFSGIFLTAAMVIVWFRKSLFHRRFAPRE